MKEAVIKEVKATCLTLKDKMSDVRDIGKGCTFLDSISLYLEATEAEILHTQLSTFLYTLEHETEVDSQACISQLERAALGSRGETFVHQKVIGDAFIKLLAPKGKYAVKALYQRAYGRTFNHYEERI